MIRIRGQAGTVVVDCDTFECRKAQLGDWEYTAPVITYEVVGFGPRGEFVLGEFRKIGHAIAEIDAILTAQARGDMEYQVRPSPPRSNTEIAESRANGRHLNHCLQISIVATGLALAMFVWLTKFLGG